MTDTRAMTEDLRDFLNGEDGAVTVDWVVLAAAVVLLAVPIATTVRSSVTTAAVGIADQVTAAAED